MPTQIIAYVGPERAYPHSSNDIYMSHLSLKDTQDFLRKGTAIINMPQTNPPKGSLSIENKENLSIYTTNKFQIFNKNVYFRV